MSSTSFRQSLRRLWALDKFSYSVRVFIALTGTMALCWYQDEMGLLIPLFLGIIASALAETDDSWQGRLNALAVTLVCFLVAALSVELLFLGLAVTSERIAGWRIVGVTAALGLTVLGFAVLGNLILAGASPAVLAGTLSFSAAALLYLVTEELLMEAHGVEEKPIATLVLFGGFLVFWAIQLMGH